MFVLEALVLTALTTPLVEVIYPARLRTKPVDGELARRVSVASSIQKGDSEGVSGVSDDFVSIRSRFTVVLDRMEHVPSL